MSSRTPPLLEPYLGLPEEASLIVLTNVLGASSNWLVLRYLHSILQKRGRQAGGAGEQEGKKEEEEEAGVVLVSFMRDMAFWREGAGRLGIDLDGLGRAGRFSFVDGLTGLFTGGEKGAAVAPGGVGGGKDGRVLRSDRLDDVRSDVEAALGDVRARSKVLVVDQLDELLAASGEESVSSSALGDMLLSLRERVHATILTFSADAPLLLHSRAATTPLERSHAALVLSQAHAADAVLGLRMLDTGVARDVSGVVRIVRRGGQRGGSGEGGGSGVEYLYHVAGDGGVRVFERGA